MFIRLAIIVAMLVVGMHYFLEYRDWLEWNSHVVLRVAPGPCETVIKGGGSEDLVHIRDNIVIITQGLNWDMHVGSISALDVSTNKVTRLNITNGPNRDDFLAGPHGMTSWKDPETGQLFLYVLTHTKLQDRVEVFVVSDTLTLNYIKTITDPLFTLMNDLVAVDKDKFYITSIWSNREKIRIVVEIYLRMRNGRILYYDGHKAREVATGYFMANGINISPDKSVIYMAETGHKRVHAFHRESTNNLRHMWEVGVAGDPDNINVDPDTGDLWIGCQMLKWTTVDFFGWFGSPIPSQVVRIKLRDNMVSEVERIYSDNGSELVGASVAVYINRKLVIGSVLSQAVVCDVNYLSP